MRGETRRGKIAGMMVILLLFILIPTWAVGHWLAGSYPAVAGTDAKVTAVSAGDSKVNDLNSGDLNSGDLKSENPHCENVGASTMNAASTSGGSQTGLGMDFANQDDGPESGMLEREATDDDSSLANELAAELAAAKNLAATERENAQSEIRALQLRQQQVQKQAEQQTETLASKNRVLADQIRQLEMAVQEKDRELKKQKEKMVVAAEPIATPPPQLPPDRRRRWTSNNRKTVMATFLGIKDNTVLLYSQDKIYPVPMSKLTPADQQIAVELDQ